MQRTRALIAGIFAGITSPGMVGAATEYPRLSGSDLGRIRSDVARVGRDFSTVMRREREHGEKSGKTAR